MHRKKTNKHGLWKGFLILLSMTAASSKKRRQMLTEDAVLLLCSKEFLHLQTEWDMIHIRAPNTSAEDLQLLEEIDS